MLHIAKVRADLSPTFSWSDEECGSVTNKKDGSSTYARYKSLVETGKLHRYSTTRVARVWTENYMDSTTNFYHPYLLHDTFVMGLAVAVRAAELEAYRRA